MQQLTICPMPVCVKELDIEPLSTIDHGPTITLYYTEPDGNIVEVFDDGERSRASVQNSLQFAANPTGMANHEALVADLHQ